MNYRRQRKFEGLAFKGELGPDGPQRLLDKQIQKLARRAPLKWGAVVILFVLTTLATYFTVVTARQSAITDFEKATREVSSELQQRVNDYTNVLLAIQALYSASIEVNRKEFHDFYESMQRTTHLPGLTRVTYVTPQRVLAFAEPASKYENLIGTTMRTEEDLTTFLRMARDSGGTIASPLVSLEKQSPLDSILFFKAIYRNNAPLSTPKEREAALQGYLIAAVQIDQMLGDGVGSFLRANDISIEIFKRNTPSESASSLKVYPSRGTRESSASDFKREIDFDVAQMVWTVKFTVQPFSDFFSNARTIVFFVLCGGVLFATVVSYLLLSSFRSRQSLLYLAKDKTQNVEEVNDLLRQILDSIPAPVLLKNEELQVLIWNKAFEELSGIDRDEILGLTGYESFPAEELDGYFEVDRQVLETQKLIAVEEKLTTKGGEKRIIITKKVPIRAKHGSCYLLGISEDITQKRQRENADKIQRNLEQRS